MLTDNEFNNLSIMSDEDLRILAKRLGFAINKITFAEELNINKGLPYGVNIINLGDNQIQGTHWTLWYVPRDDNKTYYFDSYGAPPEDPIVKMSFKHNLPVIVSGRQLQGYNESHCGVWALVMAKILVDSKKKDRLEAYSNFVNNPEL